MVKGSCLRLPWLRSDAFSEPGEQFLRHIKGVRTLSTFRLAGEGFRGHSAGSAVLRSQPRCRALAGRQVPSHGEGSRRAGPASQGPSLALVAMTSNSPAIDSRKSRLLDCPKIKCSPCLSGDTGNAVWQSRQPHSRNFIVLSEQKAQSTNTQVGLGIT